MRPDTAAAAYRAAQERVWALVADLPDALAVPATPRWGVRDLLAHLVGVAADVGAVDVDLYALPEGNAAHVARRAGRSRELLRAEWDDALPGFLDVVAAPSAHGLDGVFGVLPVIDILAHEHDLREATGMAELADPTIWELVGPRRRDALDIQIEVLGLPPLEVHTPEGDHWSLGGGPPTGSVTVLRYELWRSLEGRRTRDHVRAFAWDTDPEPYLSVWPALTFHWPEDG